MKLYTYWRSSAAYRVRIALNLKQVGYDSVPVHLVRDGGEQLTAAYRAVNPAALVPALRISDDATLTQSLAIIEYLEETYPAPRLLPADPVGRARVRAAALLIAADIHPINNLRVTQYLKTQLTLGEQEVVTWMRHWMRTGLEAYAQLVEPATPFSFGDMPTLADICLVPQLYNARRWGLDFAGLERLLAIEESCRAIAAFADAAPERQADAE